MITKISECRHSPKANIPVMVTPSGKHMTKCGKCKRGYCIEEEAAARNFLNKTKNDGLSFDDAVHAVRTEATKKAFWRKKYAHKNRPYFTPPKDND